MVTWQKLDATTFCDLVTEFLSLHPSLEPSDEEKDATDFKNNDENKTLDEETLKIKRIYTISVPSLAATCISETNFLKTKKHLLEGIFL